MSDSTLLLLGAVAFGWWLGRRRSRAQAYGPPPGWGAAAPRSAPSAKTVMVGIILISALLAGFAQVLPADGVSRGSAPKLGSIFGAFGSALGNTAPKILGPKVTATSQALLKSKRLELTPAARADLKAGRVDRDLVAILAQLLRSHRLSVSVFKTGHTKYVAGTRRISRHWSGRGVDIWKVDGGLVRAGHRPSLDVTRRLVRIRPHPAEVGSPFGRLGSGFFTDRAHHDHLHIGVR